MFCSYNLDGDRRCSRMHHQVMKFDRDLLVGGDEHQCDQIGRSFATLAIFNKPGPIL